MIPTTENDATNTMWLLVTNAIKDNQLLIGYLPEIRYQGFEVDRKPPEDKVWCRLSKVIAKSSQSSFPDTQGRKLYVTTGMVYVQMFVPKKGNIYNRSKLLREEVVNVFRKGDPSNQVVFTDMGPREPNSESNYYQLQAVSQFSFTTVV